MKKFKIALIVFFLVSGFAFSQSTRAALISCDSLAKDNNGNSVAPDKVEENWIHIQIPIPGVTTNCLDDMGNKTYVSKAYIQDLGAYIAGMYKWFSGAIGILSAVMILYGGLKWITAGGNRSSVQSAKEVVFSSLIALVIALGSYLLLYVISPNLVNLRPPALVMVKPIQQSFANCPIQGSCIDGTTIGKACNGDIDCAGGGAGACDFGVELTGGDWAPACGVEYSYKAETTANVSDKATCIGLVCGVREEGDVCASKSNPLNQPNKGDAECVTYLSRCENFTDFIEDVGAGSHESECRKLSVTGAGKCSWFAEATESTAPDHCIWKEALSCPDSSWERVGCSACAAVSCPRVDQDLYKGVSIVNFIETLGLYDESAKCESDSAGEAIYWLDRTTDNHASSICCHKKGSAPAQYQCITNPQ